VASITKAPFYWVEQHSGYQSSGPPGWTNSDNGDAAHACSVHVQMRFPGDQSGLQLLVKYEIFNAATALWEWVTAPTLTLGSDAAGPWTSLGFGSNPDYATTRAAEDWVRNWQVCKLDGTVLLSRSIHRSTRVHMSAPLAPQSAAEPERVTRSLSVSHVASVTAGVNTTHGTMSNPRFIRGKYLWSYDSAGYVAGSVPVRWNSFDISDPTAPVPGPTVSWPQRLRVDTTKFAINPAGTVLALPCNDSNYATSSTSYRGLAFFSIDADGMLAYIGTSMWLRADQGHQIQFIEWLDNSNLLLAVHRSTSPYSITAEVRSYSAGTTAVRSSSIVPDGGVTQSWGGGLVPLPGTRKFASGFIGGQPWSWGWAFYVDASDLDAVQTAYPGIEGGGESGDWAPSRLPLVTGYQSHGGSNNNPPDAPALLLKDRWFIQPWEHTFDAGGQQSYLRRYDAYGFDWTYKRLISQDSRSSGVAIGASDRVFYFHHDPTNELAAFISNFTYGNGTRSTYVEVLDLRYPWEPYVAGNSGNIESSTDARLRGWSGLLTKDGYIFVIASSGLFGLHVWKINELVPPDFGWGVGVQRGAGWAVGALNY
jgi:hypothetical protein